MNETDSELDGEWDLLPTSALVNNRKGIVAPRLMRLSSREDISLGEELYDSRLDDLILHSNGFLYPIFSRLQKDQHIACNICNTFVVGGVPVYSHMKGRKHAKALLGGPNVECNLKARLDVEYEFPKVKSIKEIPSTSSEYRGRESGFITRYLSILDDQLGSLAPLIRSILKKAKKAESAVKGGSNDLLSDDSVMNVLDLTKEKLIGNLTSGVLEKRNRKLTKRGIDYILALYKLHSQMLWLTMSAEVVENRPSTSSQLPTHPDFSMEVNAPDLSNQAPARNH
ncbi:hypothetical protein QYM36_002176 [Artemia franciscana]|uniref:Uncharacterized protein n=1 Tax=Artemia franciscana TaxID=6661 RepID=A0AA88HG91_ARTSF|nr:hypothetical protein QYM36_013415 [Artemia franciscana]KAK2723739.1 hypothetical protein QYM36_002176 [Artemia franciscana]